MKYVPVIGLEVHAELSTATKIFCGCENKFGGEVNTKVCEICSGMPGTLPKLNKKVIEYAVKMGLATNCTINTLSKSDRKNYFYPDLPKAYQISQYDIPICENGYVTIYIDGQPKKIRLTRIHIEEDAGKLLHDDAFAGSLVDYNRCGVPLIEIVSEPDMRSAEEAKAFLEQIKLILMYLDISDCRMQEGSIRCDVNVSLMPEGADKFGTRAEMKNVNSFSAAFRGINFEIARQTEILNEGGEVVQETRRWDDIAGTSTSMRSKEDAQDYRYFPDPDLAVIEVDDAWIEKIKSSIPELPEQRLNRYLETYKLSEWECGQLVSNLKKAAFFDDCTALDKVSAKSVCNWILGDLSRRLNETGEEFDSLSIKPSQLVRVIELIDKNTISNTAAKKVVDKILEGESDVDKIVADEGLAQVSDSSELEGLVDEIIAANEKSVIDYKNGKTNALAFLMGQCMRASKGKGNPQIINELLIKKLS